VIYYFIQPIFFLVPGFFFLNTVKPIDLTVNLQTDLAWTFHSRSAVSEGDCIVFDMANPYTRDPIPSEYVPFKPDVVGKQTPCEFTDHDMATCEIVNSSRMKITFKKSQDSLKMDGRTTAKPFSNPYSNRRYDTFMVSMYAKCDLTGTQPKIESKTQTTDNFRAGEIFPSSIKATSSSKKIGVTDAVLSLQFKPPTRMPSKGKISLLVPNWYLGATVK